jgi:hypothetical protein
MTFCYIESFCQQSDPKSVSSSILLSSIPYFSKLPLMFQNASTEPALNSLPAEGAAFPTQVAYSDELLMATSMPNAAESEAGHLMDDLFQDLDQLLDLESPSGVSSSEAVYPVSADSEPALSSAPGNEFNSASPQSSSLVPQINQVTDLESTASAIARSYPVTPPAPTERARSGAGSYDRLLLAVGCISVIITLALWLVYQEGRRAVTPVASVAAGSGTTPANPDTSQFADYVHKSLQQIDQQQGVTTAQAAGTSGMATVTVPPTVAPGATQAATGLSRIYVPVYEFPSNFSGSGSAVAPLPGTAGTVRPNGVTPSNGFNLPFGTKPGTQPAVKPGQLPGTTTAAVSRKLVGVMDQGSRSVALVEINGITQRYEIGESIGSSGWTLVEVTKDQALIRRNGEVRSLTVGHTF